MLAAMSADQMAETLSVIAGPNASHAAQQFGGESYKAGDIAAAMLWSEIAHTLEHWADSVAQELATQPIPRRLLQSLESIAFQDARFEDVDAETLAREEA